VERAREIGARAKACSEAQRGATATALARIVELRAEAATQVCLPLPVRGLFGLWHWGSAIARRVQTARRVRLRAPVISVGNLTMGGSGKTPMALYLAGKLARPAILTRGYRRQGTGNLILGAGETAAWLASPVKALLARDRDLRSSVDFSAAPHTIPGAMRAEPRTLEEGGMTFPPESEVILFCS
jgi:hypothetical protein